MTVFTNSEVFSNTVSKLGYISEIMLSSYRRYRHLKNSVNLSLWLISGKFLKGSIGILFFVFCSNLAFAKEEIIIPQFTIGWYFPQINSQVNRIDFQVSLDFWMDEFNRSKKIQTVETRLFDHIENLKNAFNRGELSLIVVPPMFFVKYFDLNTLADGFVGTNQLGNPYGLVLLSRKDSNIETVNDFKNKRLVMPKSDLLAEIFLGALVIPQFNQNYQQVFSTIQLLNKQNAIIHSLFFDQADVAVASFETFNLMVELNPQIKDKIQIMEVFLTDSPNYSYFHYQFPETHRQIIVAEILRLNDSVRAREILNNFRMEAVAECPVSALDPIIRLNKHYNQLVKEISQP